MDNEQIINKRPNDDNYSHHSEPPQAKRQMMDFSDGGRYRSSTRSAQKQKLDFQNCNEKLKGTVCSLDGLLTLTPGIIVGHPNKPNRPSCSALEEPEVIDLSVDIVLRRLARPTPEFPRFKTGNVYIDLTAMDKKYSYQLDAAILSRASLWFEKTLDQPMMECDERLAEHFTKLTGVFARYELQFDRNADLGVLARVVSHVFIEFHAL